MDISILKSIILDQHEVIREMKINKRFYELEDNICYVLVGLRRAGKSTLLYSKVMDYIRKGIHWNQIIYINFEDERLSEFTCNDFQDILVLKNELTTDKAFFFFDEIQNIDGWEKFARRMADSNEIVCITGSNSKMLSSEISAKLGGRYISKYIMPYSFKEFVLANNTIVDNSTKSQGLINLRLNEFLNFGGLPAIINYKNKREYLNSVYSKLLLNDVLIHNNIRNEQYMRILIKKLAETVKDEKSYTKLNNIMKTIGFKSSKDTIINYISFLMDANLIFRVKNYYAAFVDKESTPKYYFTDNGLLNLFLNDKNGLLFENLIAIELKRRGKEFYYLKSSKTGVDLDFYIPEDNTAIQVAINIRDMNTYNREVQSFLKLSENDKSVKMFIITLDENRIIEIDNKKVQVISISKFLLN